MTSAPSIGSSASIRNGSTGYAAASPATTPTRSTQHKRPSSQSSRGSPRSTDVRRSRHGPIASPPTPVWMSCVDADDEPNLAYPSSNTPTTLTSAAVAPAIPARRSALESMSTLPSPAFPRSSGRQSSSETSPDSTTPRSPRFSNSHLERCAPGSPAGGADSPTSWQSVLKPGTNPTSTNVRTHDNDRRS